ncbi:MAG: tRNA (N6-threonylcarbamoyladenosine(37)-N6)-methyltransferase TrmO [Clostridia bacterium]|nr:tRNA (N6-threonylcarbamoyladenosine(37)-N6)-methyltransferase TrmO [Clostridia bacterium]
MANEVEIKPIAYIYNDFSTKFGIPRQSGLCDVFSEIVFEKEFRCDEALRGIDEYSHLWLIWQFSESVTHEFRPTVRPPRLGGNKRVGVFATRSPFRPNSLGLSCVKLEEVKKIPGKGSVLIVSGADLKNGTPIFDIKPYLTLSDCHPEAVCGFSDAVKEYELTPDVPDELLEKIAPEKRKAVIAILKNDPRPSYHSDDEREYGFEFGEYEIKFRVKGNNITVTDIICK